MHFLSILVLLLVGSSVVLFAFFYLQNLFTIRSYENKKGSKPNKVIETKNIEKEPVLEAACVA